MGLKVYGRVWFCFLGVVKQIGAVFLSDGMSPCSHFLFPLAWLVARK